MVGTLWTSINKNVPATEVRFLPSAPAPVGPHFYSLHETSLFMIPAQLTYRTDNLIHLPQGHSVHLLVQFIEVCLYLFAVSVYSPSYPVS